MSEVLVETWILNPRTSSRKREGTTRSRQCYKLLPSEKGKTQKGLKGFHLNDKAGIWP